MGAELRGIDLDPHRRLLLAANRDESDARHLRQPFEQDAFGIIIHCGQRQCLGGQAENQHRRVGGVCHAEGGGRRQRRGQIGFRRVDRRLHLERGGLHRHGRPELKGNLDEARRARRGHLREAGNLAELTFERRRHRRGVGLPVGAGKLRRHLDGGDADIGQRGDRKLKIGQQADDREGDRQHHRRHRPPDEEAGNATIRFGHGACEEEGAHD